jgi:hypothetical protein
LGSLSSFLGLDKSGEGTVKGTFHFHGKTACRQLLHLQVIANALTAFALAAAWFVSAIAYLQILVLIALHGSYYI